MKICEVMKKYYEMPELAKPHIQSVYNTLNPLPRGYKAQPSDDYCAEAVTAAAQEAGLLDTIYPECSAPEMYKHMDEVYDPRPDDLVFFDWNKDGGMNHVGVVYAVSGNTITTYEGNVGGRMYRRVFNLSEYKRTYGERGVRFCRPKVAKADHSSCWGDAALNWAVNMGIMSGDPDGSLRPHDTLTREEAAKMFQNAFRILGN